MISSDSPSRQGARTELLVSEIGFRVVAAYRTSFWKSFEPPVSFTSRGRYSCEGRPRECRRAPDLGQARPGLGRAWAWSGPALALLLLPFWLRDSSVKIMGFPIFLDFSPKVEFLHKNKTPEQFCWKQRQSGLVAFKITQIWGETIAKVFEKVDTFWTYQLPPSLANCLSSSNSVPTESDKRNFHEHICFMRCIYSHYMVEYSGNS